MKSNQNKYENQANLNPSINNRFIDKFKLIVILQCLLETECMIYPLSDYMSDSLKRNLLEIKKICRDYKLNIIDCDVNYNEELLKSDIDRTAETFIAQVLEGIRHGGIPTYDGVGIRLFEEGISHIKENGNNPDNLFSFFIDNDNEYSTEAKNFINEHFMIK